MYYRIMCRNKERTEAFVEQLRDIKPIDNGRVVCVGLDNSCNFASVSDIVKDPEIIRSTSAGWLFKIKLEG